MDSFELNKIMGAILGTLLLLLSLNIFAGGIFTPHKPAKPGFEIAVAESGGGAAVAAPAEQQVPIADLLASASAEKGAAVSKKCVACHEFKKGGPNKVGPDLYGVVGRLGTDQPTVSLRVGAYGYFLPVAWCTVFNGAPGAFRDAHCDSPHDDDETDGLPD